MKIVFEKQSFLEKLAPAMATVSGRGTISAVEGVLIETLGGNTVRLSTYDMQKGIRITFEAVEVLEEGSYIIPANRLLQIVRLMPDGEMEIDVDDKYNATVIGENSHFSLFAQKGSDFPNLPELRGDKNFTVFSDVLRRTIGKVIHSVAEIDSRPMLCGAYFRVQENRLEVVSCDSFTLSKCSIACEIHDVGTVKAVGSAFNIPGHALNEMVRLLPDKKVDVSVQIARKHAIFILGDMLFFTRLIDGEYIDYQRIIPKDNPICVKVERDRLLGALERSNLVAEEKIQGAVRSYVKIILDGDEMTVTSSSVNGRVKDDISCDHEGEDLEIAFNCKYLLNCVRAADADGLLLTLKSPTQSITMEPLVKNPDDDFFYLVQPVRMHE